MDAAREAARAKAAAEAEPDDEGWITVSRHSGKTKRKPLGLGTKTGQAKIKARALGPFVYGLFMIFFWLASGISV